MSPQRTGSIATALLLAGSTLLTGVIVGLVRFWIANPAPGVQSESQELRALIIHLAVFLVGGIPAVVATWLLIRRKAVTGARRAATVAVMGNAPSGLLALLFLPVFIWETPDWLLTAVSAYGVGCITFFVVLYVDFARKGGVGSASRVVRGTDDHG